MHKLIIATNNKGKIREFNALLEPIQCIPQSELGISDAEETGLTFIENALLKARHASRHTGMPALADDSGLVVPALNGAPGIYSARYAGEPSNNINNIHLLLHNMSHLADEQRQAYFYCALALVLQEKDPTPIITTGIFHGLITHEPIGDQGFGYDPVFFVQEYQCTAAQLSATIKNTISHRAQALNQLHAFLPKLL